MFPGTMRLSGRGLWFLAHGLVWRWHAEAENWVGVGPVYLAKWACTLKNPLFFRDNASREYYRQLPLIRYSFLQFISLCAFTVDKMSVSIVVC